MTSIPATKAAISALKIEQRVERDVKAGIPEVDRRNHTDSEESMRSYVVREIIGRVHENRQSELDKELADRSEVDIRQLYQEMKNTESLVEKTIAARLANLVSGIKQRAQEYSALRMDLEMFRERNGLTREAVYRESKMLHFSIVFFIVILETVLNAFFLSKGSALGLVGGFFQAFIISMINLGFAAFLAFSLRHCFHLNPLRKLGAGVLFGAVLVTSVVFVLGVGHYREALEADPFTASQVAMSTLQAEPLGIQDFNSWIMVVVSGIALVLLTAKFFVVDDRYPGYTAITRRVKSQHTAWRDAHEDAIESVNQMAEEIQDGISDTEKTIRAQFIQFKASIERSEEIHRHYHEDIIKAQGLLDELVRYYQSYSARMMNRRSAYFGELLRFELEKLPRLNTTGLEQHKQDLATFEQVMDELDHTYTGAIDVVNRRCETIQAALSELVDKLELDHGLRRG
ncbi:ABC transporter permease [Microbulbifer agarilyticus]|uniref:ABC transporter permease n=1 Tax=Microbulbifer agarilyticus TaxID=260552 RepID=UPI001C9399C0|nr:ABC transporter permease [Microbulbifer agarilyticus]MBY6191372.1 ABC transporter permease [Microbulbifer agarilyticus]